MIRAHAETKSVTHPRYSSVKVIPQADTLTRINLEFSFIFYLLAIRSVFRISSIPHYHNRNGLIPHHEFPDTESDPAITNLFPKDATEISKGNRLEYRWRRAGWDLSIKFNNAIKRNNVP